MEDELVQLSYWVSMLKQEIECSICLQTLKDPVTTRCFHTFCKACIARVIKIRSTSMCPLCKTKINRRGAEINSKIKVFVDKINPIIQVIEKGSSVDIFSFYKGKSSSEHHYINRNFIDKQLFDSNAVNLDRISPKSFHKRSINSNRDELNSAHNNENFSEIEHVSVSQNICAPPHLSKSSVLPSSMIKFPLVESINSPAKKVKEWLCKNDVESSPCSPLSTITKGIDLNNEGIDIFEEKLKSKETDVIVEPTEFDLNKSCKGKMRKSVYKGLRAGRDEFPTHDIRNYSKRFKKEVDCGGNLNNEKELDGIEDSCPVEMNDTFDRLVGELRECDRPDSPPEKSEAEDQNEIGLFESLPLPAENCGSKRKRYRYGSKLEDKDISLKSDKSGSCQKSYKVYKKRKCFHENERKMNAEVLEDVSHSSIKEKDIQLELDKPGIGEFEKHVGVDSANKEKNESVHNQEEKASPDDKFLSKIVFKPKTSKIGLLNNSATKLEKLGKKRLDLSLSSPGWSRLNSTRKDFQKSKLNTLPTLDVSGGDPCNTLTNRLHLCKNLMKSPEILGVKPLSSTVCIDDAESNHACLVAAKINSKKKTEIEHLNTPISSHSKLKEPTLMHHHKKSESKGFPDNCEHGRKFSTQKAGSKLGICNNIISKNYEKKEITGLCKKENFDKSCSSAKYKSMALEYHSHQACSNKSPSSRKKLKSHLSDLTLVERKTFSLNSSTQDLNELIDAIQIDSTEDQLEAFAKCPLPINTNESPCKDYLKKTSFVEDQEKCHFDIFTDVGCRRKCIKSRDLKGNETDSNTEPRSSKERPVQSKNIFMKSKLVVPIFKLGRLKEKSLSSRRKVNYYLLGKVRHCDGAVKMTSEAGIATDSLTLLKKRLSLEKGFELKKNKDVEVQTMLTFLKDQTAHLVDKGCQRSDKCESLKAISEISHCCSENGMADGGENALNNAVPVEENMDERKVTLIAETDCLNSNLVKELQKTEQNEYQTVPNNDNSQEISSIEYVKGSGILESQNSNEELVELIPNTERSGPKILLANRFKNSSNGDHVASHQKEMNSRSYYQSLNSRRGSRGGRKPVCQLFTANAGDVSEKEIALPISCTQTSELQQSNNIKHANVCRLKNPRVISLSSDSSSDQEAIGKSQKKRVKSKRMSSQKKSYALSKKEKSLEENISGKASTRKPSPARTVEIDNSDDSLNNFSSVTDDGKHEIIIANIQADMNIRKNREQISGIKLAENGDNKKDETSPTNQKSNVITPSESKAATLYVEESDLSENETCNRVDSSIKEQCENDSNSKVGGLPKEASDEESDCIIEGSQETTNFKEKSVSMRKGPISLVASCLPWQEVANVKSLAEMFNLHFSTEFCGLRSKAGIPSTTHVVAKVDSNGTTSCTFKYLCGVITGCWIVSIKWVTDCLTAGMLVEEEPYEVLDTGGGNGPSRGRHATQKLFLGFEFICKEPFSELPGDQLEEIIQLGGGKVVSSFENFSGVKGRRLAVSDPSSVNFNAEFNRLMRLHDIAVISCEWIVECIEEYRILSLTNYVLNMDIEPRSHQIVQEKLLKMGYAEDLVKIDDEPVESSALAEIEESDEEAHSAD